MAGTRKSITTGRVLVMGATASITPTDKQGGVMEFRDALLKAPDEVYPDQWVVYMAQRAVYEMQQASPDQVQVWRLQWQPASWSRVTIYAHTVVTPEALKPADWRFSAEWEKAFGTRPTGLFVDYDYSEDHLLLGARLRAAGEPQSTERAWRIRRDWALGQVKEWNAGPHNPPRETFSHGDVPYPSNLFSSGGI